MSGNDRPVALVTGALGGIGSALVDAFAAAGYRVLATDLRDDKGRKGEFLPMDVARLVTDGGYRSEAVARLHAAIGGGGLAVLINNAAVQRLGGIEELLVEEIRETFDTNVLGPMVLLQALLAQLETAQGSVINVASVHATLTKPGFAAYATSKAALVGLTRSAAVDLGSRVRVNAILPAATDTPMLRAGFKGDPAGLAALAAMHPNGRIATPAEIASVAVFLASKGASAITGAVLGVDGGIAGRLHDPA